MKTWFGKVALVTGASSGIGAAIAERLASEGMKVVAAARRLDRLESLAQSATGGPGEVLPYAVDLRDTDAIVAMFEAVRKRWGGVDVLVNNAGLGYDAPLISGDTDAWRETLEVNVLALCVCTREALQDMRREGVGHVIHVSSMSAHRVPEGSGIYSASKFAVRSLTESLRRELRAMESDIRVTELSPGFVETEFAQKYHGSETKARETYDRYPVLQAQDIAEAAFYVLSQPAHVEVHDILMRPTRQTS